MSARDRVASVARIPTSARPLEGHVKTGWICDGPVEDGLRIDFHGNSAGPIPARTTVEIPARRDDLRREVTLVFEDGDLLRPIVVGVLRAPGADTGQGQPPMIAEIDGRRLVVEGRDEIVLRCGEASITLRRNGRVVIRGAEVETRASGTNKVRGGSVRIN